MVRFRKIIKQICTARASDFKHNKTEKSDDAWPQSYILYMDAMKGLT